MDLQTRVRWEHYTKAKEEMFARTNIPEAPWTIVEGNDKKRARLNCIAHLLTRSPTRTCRTRNHPARARLQPRLRTRGLPPELYVPGSTDHASRDGRLV